MTDAPVPAGNGGPDQADGPNRSEGSEGLEVDREVFRAAMSRLPAGVVVVATRWRGVDQAMTASAVASVSLEPPFVLFCVHADARLREALDEVDLWTMSVLSDGQEGVADWLASPGRPSIGQLDRVPHTRAPRSGAAWVNGAAAWLECRTAQVHRVGDHDIVVGEVLEAREGPADAGGLVHLRRRTRGLR